MLKSICIYCGSSTGAAEVYADAMRQLARKMIDENIALVYGGGKVGLMGILADEMLRLVREVAPTLFKNAGPSCVKGSCPEGKMSCGKISEMRAYYRGTDVKY